MIKKVINWKSIIMRRTYWLFFKIKKIDYEPGILKLGNSNFSFMPNDLINSNSIIYSFGAGEDIHWEIELIRKYNCQVYLFDPTPRAYDHFNLLKNNTLSNIKNFSADSKIYNATPSLVDKIIFITEALWDKDEIVKFFEPQKPKDVSHSITNLQKTEKYIQVQAYKLKTIMKYFNHSHIDYVKMDIEGAEYNVIKDIISDQIDIRGISVEFHYTKDVNDFYNVKRLFNTLRLLNNNGYKIIHRQTYKYFTLIK